MSCSFAKRKLMRFMGPSFLLRLMLQNYLTEYLQKTFEEMIQKQKEFLGRDLS